MISQLEIIDTCISCDNCKLFCPENAVLTSNGKYLIEPFACTLCGICIEVCPVDCIKVTKEEQ